jgi:hypothetical protein
MAVLRDGSDLWFSSFGACIQRVPCKTEPRSHVCYFYKCVPKSRSINSRKFMIVLRESSRCVMSECRVSHEKLNLVTSAFNV